MAILHGTFEELRVEACVHLEYYRYPHEAFRHHCARAGLRSGRTVLAAFRLGSTRIATSTGRMSGLTFIRQM